MAAARRASKGCALITGAAKRIGSVMALHLAELGYDIALHHHHSEAQAETLAKHIRKKGQACERFACDLSDPDAAKKLISSARKVFPKLSILINNASLFERSPMKSSGFEVLQRHFAVHCFAPYILSREFARLCKKGTIINLLDTNVAQNKVTHTAYLLSKKTLAEMTRLAAVELAPHIRVNGIAPGMILAPEGKPAGYLQKRVQTIPLKKKGDPKDIARTVQFLLENDFITGQIVFVDGGEHLL